MKTVLFFSHILSIVFLMSQNSCAGPEYTNNSRIFVEGKLISQSGEINQIRLQAGDILISETKTQSDGSFKLGGPGATGEETLMFSKKIKSFIANDNECRLSNDSLVIILPGDKTYFNFTQITLAP